MATISIMNLVKGDILTTAHIYAMNRVNEGTGYLTGLDVHQKASPGMGVTIDSGTLMYAGAYVTYAGGDLVIDAADGTNPRFDIVYVNSAGSPAVVKGTAAAILPTGETAYKKMTTPYPAASVAAGTILARVYVAAGVTSILDAAIDDIAIPVGNVPLVTLTARGDIPYRSATTWTKLSKGTAGYFLKQGADDPAWAGLATTDPVFTNTARILGRKTSGGGAGEECTFSEILDFVGSAARGDILYRGVSTWSRLAKGAAGQYIIQGASDPAWTTPTWEAAYPFGDGTAVLLAQELGFKMPNVASKIIAVSIREQALISSVVDIDLYIHDIDAAKGSSVDAFDMSSVTHLEEESLNHAVAANKWVTIALSGTISGCKQLTVSLTFERTA
jgi:hypothetical protein